VGGDAGSHGAGPDYTHTTRTAPRAKRSIVYNHA
jgi:hypothetical protein